MIDARTTPRVLRIPVMAGLVMFGLWLLGCARYAATYVGASLPPEYDQYNEWFWLGRWRMFTETRPTHGMLRVSAIRGRTIEEVDLETMFPIRAADGPGYHRPQFWQRPGRVLRMAEATCRREYMYPEPLDEVRFWVEFWPKTIGQAYDPSQPGEVEFLGSLACHEGKR